MVLLMAQRKAKTSGRIERRDALIEAALALSSELPLPVVLEKIIELAAEITHARYGALGVIGPGGEITQFITNGVTQEQHRAIGDLPVGRGILGFLIENARPLRLRNLSEHSRSVGFPKNHPPMYSFLGAPVKAHGKVFGNIYLTEKQGAEEFDEDDERTLNALATQAGVAIGNSQLYEETRRRERSLDALREVNAAILSEAPGDDVLGLVVLRARELVNADLATLVILTDEPGTLRIAVADGSHSKGLVGMEVPVDGSVSGDVIKSGQPVMVADASQDPRTYRAMVRQGKMGPSVFVPLTLRGEAFGTLSVAHLVGGTIFTQEEMLLVQTFADQASLALEYARAQGELQRLMVMDERERIATELHDGVIQSLFAVGLGLQATAMRATDPEVGTRIEEAVGEIDRAIRDLRNYIFGLRPGILADRQLDQALRDLAGDFGAKNGISVSIEIDPAIAAGLSPSAGEIVQLAREALSNIGRHAEATTTSVVLTREGTTTMLEIRDDGTGFDTTRRRRAGHEGLANLKKRAAALGGKAEIKSAPGTGTRVRIMLPG
jgi:signal transduction histidine kinase